MGDVTPVLGILCGLAEEADTLGPLRDDPRLMVRISAGRVDRSDVAAGEMVMAGVQTIVSWGYCGGLDPTLRPGDLIECDVRDVFAAELVIATAAQKANARASGARIVDLESGSIARLGLGGRAIRVVLDESSFDLPAPALIPLLNDGRPDVWKVMGKCLFAPWTFRPMIGVALRRRCALRSLRRARSKILGILQELDGAD